MHCLWGSTSASHIDGLQEQAFFSKAAVCYPWNCTPTTHLVLQNLLICFGREERTTQAGNGRTHGGSQSELTMASSPCTGTHSTRAFARKNFHTHTHTLQRLAMSQYQAAQGQAADEPEVNADSWIPGG